MNMNRMNPDQVQMELDKLDRHWLRLSDSLQEDEMTEFKANKTKKKMQEIEDQIFEIENHWKKPEKTLLLEIEN